MGRVKKEPEIGDEVARLRASEVKLHARVTELEAELAHRGLLHSGTTESRRTEISESIADTSNLAIEQISRIIRGMVLANLEQIRANADVVDSFVDTIINRNQPGDEGSIMDLVLKLPGDVYAGALNALQTTLEIPNKAINELRDSYQDTENMVGRRRRASGAATTVQEIPVSRRETAITQLEIEEQRVKHAVGRPVSRVVLDRSDKVILNVGDVITNQAISQARLAGVLDILLDSVYEKEPDLASENLGAPEPGEASLEKQANRSAAAKPPSI